MQVWWSFWEILGNFEKFYKKMKNISLKKMPTLVLAL